MWITCKTLFIEQEITVKKYIAFSELVVLAVNRATTVTKNKFVNFEHVFVSWTQDKIHQKDLSVY